ncbi:MICOS complex subunit MIC13 homolog QIL1 [Athalia rosae]|uniref:MICOS complex subunit MIC13 homolog QIL1 n=1 Tax=Athalia rosae TaxID=37344 RepID=UPI000626A3BC|nr:MICOS complex subunit MIC13 homolog QIL1 [Athalia rosae]
MKMGVLRFAVKATAASGITYYTKGLWSEPEDSMKLYCKIYDTVTPYVEKNIPMDVVPKLPKLPNVTDIMSLVETMWNKGIITSFKFISELSEHTSRGIEVIGIKEAISSAIDSLNAAEKAGRS